MTTLTMNEARHITREHHDCGHARLTCEWCGCTPGKHDEDGYCIDCGIICHNEDRDGAPAFYLDDDDCTACQTDALAAQLAEEDRRAWMLSHAFDDDMPF